MNQSIAGTLQLITEKLANLLEKELNETFIQKENWALQIKNQTKAAKKFVEHILENPI